MPEVFFTSLSDNKSPPTYKYFDGEKWVFSLSGKYTEIRSPIDGKVLGNIPTLTHAEIDRAISRLYKGQKDWQRIPIIKRREYIKRYYCGNRPENK